MTVRQTLKCDVCGHLVLLRTQVGWLEEHPIRIHCAKWGILLAGRAFFDQVRITCRFEFENAKVVQKSSADSYIEASGELITEKMQPFDPTSKKIWTPPFFT